MTLPFAVVFTLFTLVVISGSLIATLVPPFLQSARTANCPIFCPTETGLALVSTCSYNAGASLNC